MLSALLVLALSLRPGPIALAQAASVETRARPAVQALLDAYVASGAVPGVQAGIATAQDCQELCAGLADRARKTPLRAADLLCAGSTGKTFVAAFILQLVQEGKLALSDLAGETLGEEEWFERLPNAAELTIENLLDHRSGLPRYEFQPAFTRDLVAQPDRVWRPAELLSYVLDMKPENPAGEGFAYADTNYIVLGLIAERVSGSSLYAEVRRRLLEPLELAGVRPQDARAIPGLVQGHAGPGDPLGLPEVVLDPQGRFVVNPQFEWAGGGFVTNAGSLARWARALYGGSVLGAEMRAAMVTGHDAPELGRGVQYGLGAIVWNTRHGKAVGHSGFFPGYMSEMRYWPEHGIAVAVQVNTSEFARFEKPLGRLCEELLGATLTEGGR